MDSIATINSRETARAVSLTHPLHGQLREVEVPIGMTIAEALDLSLLGTPMEDWPRDQIIATVGGTRIPRAYWQRVRPRAGVTVIFRPVVANSKILRSVLLIAAAIAVLFIAPVIGAALGGFFATSVGIGLIGGALTIGASLLINALVPLRQKQIASSSGNEAGGKSLSMVGGAQNEARPWETVPQVLGRHRMSAQYAARPFTFFSAQKQYMNFLFTFGYGRLAITDMKLGETPLGDFEEVAYEVREGVSTDTQTTIFPVIPDELPLSIRLKSVDGWVERRTPSVATQLSIDLIAPQGIYSYNQSTGAYDDRPVVINLQFRRVGEAIWFARPDIVYTRTRDTQRRGDRWDVIPGQYDVRVQKLTADYTGTGTVAEEVDWITLRGLLGGHPVNFPKPLSFVALRIRGTDQLNGIVDNFNAIVQVFVKGFNGLVWTDGVLSNNPADLFRHVLQGPANARPRTDAQLDLDSIEEWWVDCNFQGFKYNSVIADRRSVRDVLADIAAAGRATVAMRDGKWGVSFPRLTDPVVWSFNPRNVTSFATERVYRELPHALRCRFLDNHDGWQERERIVYADGYNADNATLFEQVEFPGVTSRDLVWRHGRFQIAQALLRPEMHTVGTDIEALRIERGDKVEVANDVMLLGTGYGRVTAVNAGAQTVSVDSSVIMELGGMYRIRFRLSDGTVLVRDVFNTVQETQTIKLDPALTSTLPVAGDLFSFGERGKTVRNYRVLEVRPSADMGAQLILVDDAPLIDAADIGEIPDYDPGITAPPDPYTLTPQSLSISERLVGSGINTKSLVQVTVQIPRAGTIRAFEFQFRDVDTGGQWEPFSVIPAPFLVAERYDLEPGSWQFRVRSLFSMLGITGMTNNDYSAWATSPIVSLLGAFVPPGDVTNFSVTSIGEVTRLSWTPVAAPNLRNYVIRYSRLTDGAATWGTSIEVISPGTNYAELPTRAGTYSVKAVTFQGVESVNATFSIAFVEGSTRNVVEAIDEDPSFAGVRDGTDVSLGGLLALATDSGGAFGVTGRYYFAGSIDLGDTYTSRVEMILAVSGINSGDTMDTWTTLADLEALDTTDPSLWGVTPLYRWTLDDPLVSGASWSDWTQFPSLVDVTGRALEFAVDLTGSTDGRTSPGISRLGVVVDMPDRHLGFKNQQTGTAAGGLVIPFDPPFKHLTDHTISFHNLNATAGEKYEIISIDETQVTVRAKSSAGVVIDRKFDIHAYGYGVSIPLVT